MNLSSKDATSALRDIDRVAERTQQLNSYRIAGPIVMLWGLVWIVGYGGMGLLESHYWDKLWLIAELAGVVGTILLLRGVKGRSKAGKWRMLAIPLAIMAFVAATLWVFQPTPHNGVLVFPALVSGLVYVVVGAFRMTRFVWIGAAMTASALVGYAFFAPWRTFWIAGFGGLGLVLGGLWMRQV